MNTENKSTEIDNTDKKLHISDVSCCYKCGSKIKREGNSLHVWDIEYECGCRIWGALDTATHGDRIEIDVECNNN